MIKNIVFDIGNVLLNFKPRKHLEDLGFSEEVGERIYSEIFESDEWIELDKGTITEREATEIYCKKSLDIKDEIELTMANWQDILTPIEESVEILKNLKKSGYNIYFLSNFHRESYKTVYEKYDFLKLGEGKIISYEVGIVKPEKEIYEILLNKYELQSEETIFIDDSLANVEAAEKLGIKGIWYLDSEGLKISLDEYLK
ncbi:MAG: HAD family phosphatase [Cetobacterium sp.]|uniref:HAD family hydrolase n=1 Tax=unclassified Cetobacterium TaxID=2630983 RepID=UPI00163BE1BC|nr:HAD family phosphatase [Cetobacterium sp. 2A]MBC2856710.1 HAD family phosphatase [Cetobacterium sp. 2A]